MTPGSLFDSTVHVLGHDGLAFIADTQLDDLRKTRRDLKLGICGEHGGDPASVKFCHEIGLDYVSCSPFRVPIARLAAAQAIIASGSGSPKKSDTK